MRRARWAGRRSTSRIRYGVVYVHAHRTPITTAVTTSTSTSARSMEALVSPRNADCAERPISTNRELLTTVVASAQNGMTIAGGGPGDPRGHLTHEQAARDDRQDSGRVDRVGEQERRERGHGHGDALEHRVIHPATHLPADQADQTAAQHAAAERQDQQPGDVPAGQVLPPTVTPTASP